MPFTPTTPPKDTPETRWMLSELRRIAQEFEAPKEIYSFKQLNAAPIRFSEGSTVYADGTNWNPGSGEGIYTYIDGSWQKQTTPGATRITSADSPYTIASGVHDLFIDTDGGAVTVNLPAGTEGRKLRIANTGLSGNDVTVTPDGSELLIGANSSDTISDSEALIISYETTEGWY